MYQTHLFAPTVLPDVLVKPTPVTRELSLLGPPTHRACVYTGNAGCQDATRTVKCVEKWGPCHTAWAQSVIGGLPIHSSFPRYSPSLQMLQNDGHAIAADPTDPLPQLATDYCCWRWTRTLLRSHDAAPGHPPCHVVRTIATQIANLNCNSLGRAARDAQSLSGASCGDPNLSLPAERMAGLINSASRVSVRFCRRNGSSIPVYMILQEIYAMNNILSPCYAPRSVMEPFRSFASACVLLPERLDPASFPLFRTIPSFNGTPLSPKRI
jgi:hypothetical protein